MKTLKHVIWISALCLSFNIAAQQRDLSQNMQRLAEKLELTDEQSQQVKAILEEQRERMLAVREDTRAKLSEVLSEAQMQEIQQMMRGRSQRGERGERGQRGEGRSRSQD